MLTDSECIKSQDQSKAEDIFQIRQHLQSVHSKDYLRCSLCSKKNAFESTMSLLIHSSRTHPQKNEEGQLLCQYPNCDATFISPNPLTSHIKIFHYNYQPYQCDHCAKTFDTRSKKKEHMSYVHPIEKNILCDECDERFINKNKLRYHKRMSHGSGPLFVCSHCGKTFKWRNRLEAHLKAKHEQPGSHICDQCGKVFHSDISLKVHKKRHAPAQQCSCPVDGCGKILPRKDSLMAHLKYVHGDAKINKKFLCQYCPKRFSHNNQRKEHENSIHLNNKTFKCDQCDFAAVRNTYLTVHKRAAHQGIKLKCNVPGCTKAYNYTAGLYKHQFQAHNIPRPGKVK